MRQRDGLKGAIYRAIIGCNTYQGREAGGEKTILRAWWRPSAVVWVLGVLVWVWWWCRWCSGVATLQAARLQPYKFNDIQRVSLHLFCCGLNMV